MMLSASSTTVAASAFSSTSEAGGPAAFAPATTDYVDVNLNVAARSVMLPFTSDGA